MDLNASIFGGFAGPRIDPFRKLANYSYKRSTRFSFALLSLTAEVSGTNFAESGYNPRYVFAAPQRGISG